ncbi:hypothetical protein [Mycobacterium seoulense]|uniref:hypothetical protein n=1 Tax=Mycobacterium seoulense TaxID=386911 RepID=UPI003CF707F6
MDPDGKAMTFRPWFRQLAQDLLDRSIFYRTIRSLFGNRSVVREARGVRLATPSSHRLPDYARTYPSHGQNLVELALRLREIDKPLGVVDIGANIGDSAAQILAKVDARVLRVEADPEYLPYLRRNVRSTYRCVIEFGLLVTDDADASGLGALRKGGTTRFAQDGAGGAAAALAVADLTGPSLGFAPDPAGQIGHGRLRHNADPLARVRIRVLVPGVVLRIRPRSDAQDRQTGPRRGVGGPQGRRLLVCRHL